MLSGCTDEKKPSSGETGKPAKGGRSNEKPIASAPMAHEDGPAHVDLLAVDRSPKNTITVRLRIVNDGRQTLNVLSSLRDIAPKSTSEELANGIALLDGANNKVYYPLTTSTGTCACSDLTNVELDAGASQDVFAIFASPPTTTKNVTVAVPLTVPFVNIPIGAEQNTPGSGQTIDPAKVSFGQPNTRSLISTSESADEAVDDDDSNRTVRLSADVLFAYNKAELTAKARAVLQRVAKQIDASRGNVVKIDGYTDNSGTDAVNQPLSERRAQAVEGALKGMVTRQGVTYQSAGHGSQNPVAKNDDESGRRRNRRVTISFARPPAAPSSTAQPPSAGEPFQWKVGAKLPVLATARPHFGSGAASTTQEANNLKFDVNSLYRDPSGLVTLVWSVTNVSDQEQQVGGGFDRWLALEYTGETTTSGASLLDRSGQTRYWPSRDNQGVCMCTITDSASHAVQTLEPNGTVTYADVYKVPAGVGNVDVQISWYSDTINVGDVAIR